MQDGAYKYQTYAEVREKISHFRSALHGMGVRKGDTVAIISRNRLEWILAAYASYGLGAIIVPMYENQKESDWRYIVADSKAKVLIASTTAIYDKVRSNNGGRIGRD